MWQPIATLASRPDWTLRHAGLYAELVRTEAALAARTGLRRAAVGAAALVAAAVALNLVGVALLLAAGGVVAPGAAWALVGVPAVPVAAALVAWSWARRPAPPSFSCTREQLRADLAQLMPPPPVPPRPSPAPRPPEAPDAAPAR
jgi:hypothetical protein